MNHFNIYMWLVASISYILVVEDFHYHKGSVGRQ